MQVNTAEDGCTLGWTNISIGGQATLSGNLSVGSNATITGSQYVGGQNSISGNLSVGSNATITGSQWMGTNLTVSGQSSISGHLAVGSNATILTKQLINAQSRTALWTICVFRPLGPTHMHTYRPAALLWY